MGNAVQAVVKAKNLLKRCKPAVVFDGSVSQVETCGDCGLSAAARACNAENGSSVGIAHPGVCVLGLGKCRTFLAVHEAGKYLYSSKRVVECGQAVLTPFGSGVNITYYQTCCTYLATPGTGSILVQDCD